VSTIVWGPPGKDAPTLGKFFDALLEGGLDQIEAVSMDLGLAYIKAAPAWAPARAPDAVICFDPFHVIKLVTDALDSVRSGSPPAATQNKAIAKKYKGARWALLKNPQGLTDDQGDTLKASRRNGGALWRACQLKEALRAVFAGALPTADVMDLIDRWCSRAQRSRIPDFVKAAATIRKRKDGIYSAIERRLSNGRHEGLNNKIRTMTRRAYGFHSPEAALALVMLTCGPTTLTSLITQETIHSYDRRAKKIRYRTPRGCSTWTTTRSTGSSRTIARPHAPAVGRSRSVSRVGCAPPGDIPYGATGLRLIWHKRRWRCNERLCPPGLVY
jgi:transposase